MKDYNTEINQLFMKLTNLIRIIKKDVVELKNNDYKQIITSIHQIAIDIDDEVLKNISKLDVDEVKISLYDFKKQPYVYIDMFKEYFLSETIKMKEIQQKCINELDKMLLKYNLNEDQFNIIDTIYKNTIIQRVLTRYSEFGQVDPVFLFDTENEKLTLQMGKEIINYSLKIDKNKELVNVIL